MFVFYAFYSEDIFNNNINASRKKLQPLLIHTPYESVQECSKLFFMRAEFILQNYITLF